MNCSTTQLNLKNIKLSERHGEGNGNPLRYSYLGNPMDRGAWQATVYGAARVRHDWATQQQQTPGRVPLNPISDFTCFFKLLLSNSTDPGGLLSMGSHSRTRLKWLSSSSSYVFIENYIIYFLFCKILISLLWQNWSILFLKVICSLIVSYYY